MIMASPKGMEKLTFGLVYTLGYTVYEVGLGLKRCKLSYTHHFARQLASK